MLLHDSGLSLVLDAAAVLCAVPKAPRAKSRRKTDANPAPPAPVRIVGSVA